MTDFSTFSVKVHERFNAMQRHTLFETINGNDLWLSYLAAFPEGTNPIFRINTEHDCSCCKQFVRNIGAVVALKDGKRITVWDDYAEFPYPYNVVAEHLQDVVMAQPITALYKAAEPSYGAVFSRETLEDGQIKRWHHFHAKIEADHYSKQVGKEQGDYAGAVQVFKRGILEIPDTVVHDVRELIAENAIYRGVEHSSSVTAFKQLKNEYAKGTSNGDDSFWEHAFKPGARIRNTVIGTLLVDLSEGKGLEDAVKAFEAKVAPMNYKRTTALVTPSMVKAAAKQIEALGLEDALDRRYAVIEDVTINNVLFVDRGSKGKLRASGAMGVLEGMGSVTRSPNAGALKVFMDEFLKEILPSAESIEVLMKNDLQNNLVSLTAPMHLDPQDPSKLFKWSNDFGWSYNGNIADSYMRQQVQARGGSVSGVLRFTHSWNHEGRRNASLMDLHVFMPGNGVSEANQTNDSYGGNQRVGWNARKHPSSGGVQDVDYTAEAPAGYVPVENITFPSMDRLPDGRYICKIHNWQLRMPNNAGFKAEIEFGGVIYEYDYPKALGNKEWVTVAVITKKGNAFSIEHKLPHGKSSAEVWGIETEKFVKVNTVMLSPNHWDDQAIGNKHVFFMLEGCKNPEATRGIYNEFLKPSLEEHRKVFEMLGDKSKCPYSADQLSGVGFSSTKSDEVIVAVTFGGQRRQYSLSF